jgi:hypothetical protein
MGEYVRRMKPYYLNTWVEMLGEFLGWNEQQVLEWAERTGKLAYLENKDDLIYHSDPPYWIVHLMIPESLKERLPGPALADLKRRIEAACRDAEGRFFLGKGADRRASREKIEAVLADYGERLPPRLV